MESRFFIGLLPFIAVALVHCSSSSTEQAALPVAVDAGAAETGAEPPPAENEPDAAPSVRLGLMAKPRSLFATVDGRDGRVRAFGGLSSASLEGSSEAFDPVKNTWSSATASSVKRYAHAAAESVPGEFLVIGGTTDGKTPLATVEQYSASTDSWTALADLPSGRLGLAAVTGKDGRVYAIGGRGADGEPSNLVEVYTPSSKAWSAAPPMPTKRLALRAVAGADGKIYAIGGRDGDDAALPTVEAFDIDKGAWETVKPLGQARFWFGATLGLDGRIYVLGGMDALGFLDHVEAFSPAAGWQAITAMPEARAWVSAGASKDGRVFAIGGAAMLDDAPEGTQPPPTRTMLAFDSKTSAWVR